MRPRIHPSILSADFVNLEHEVGRIGNADAVHVDVMDNHFVPNLTFGQPMVERLLEVTALPLDVHLMIDDPDRWAPGFASAGAASVTFHVEGSADPIRLARAIRAKGAFVGLALKPGTPVEPWLASIAEFDMFLVMTVEPGFGGQSFMSETMPKLRSLADAVEAAGSDLLLQVDGGITTATIGIAAASGANTFVAGSAVFGSDDPNAAIEALRVAAAPGPEAGAEPEDG
ncbi:ribulose-phosphate 3-epimerase [Naasia lichenicola]|uniref:Ribulose-phosphate 3-epimerase n=1 Tax=Naasia lichenicola TaxID=2565933 RepID=A0A4S4FR14_9MICO|nr:ribulose-phosphate 3-epimerase [Naasia lichenicola]THG33063.1 ribulose-phosphate 3-epimerase [Naasia lichenicola]